MACKLHGEAAMKIIKDKCNTTCLPVKGVGEISEYDGIPCENFLRELNKREVKY